MQQNIARFIRTQKQKQLLMRIIMMMYSNQSIVRLYQTYIENLRVVLFI